MITYKPIVIQGGRRKDGTWPVKIRVTFKGRSRRLPTTFACRDADLTRSGRIKNTAILERASQLIARMRATTEDLSPFTLEEWSVDDVVAHIREAMTADTFKLDFFAFAEDFLRSKQGQTRAVYEAAVNAFARYLGIRSCDINAIGRRMLLDFATFVDAEPQVRRCKDGTYVETRRTKTAGGASAMYTAKLAHIFNAAKFRYNDEDAGRILIPRSPFEGLRKSYPASHGQRNLGVEVMQRIIDAEPAEEAERIALSAFAVSFGLMGANLADLWSAQDVGKVWVYNRQKTASKRADKAEIRVDIPTELSRHLEALSCAGEGIWLRGLRRWDCEPSARAMINRALKAWAAREGIEAFTFYAARHSWASIARAQGVEKATIDEALGHIGDYRIADIYAERNWELAWEANRRVLALFRW